MQLPFTYFHLDKNNEMIQKLSDTLKIHTATSLCYFEKDSILESLIYHLKYGGQQKLGEYFGELIIDLIKSNELFKNIEAVIPVLLNSKRKRGYNQVTVFEKKIPAYLGVPFVEGYLFKLKTPNN
jgi:predicted amidophosphoribosyltransferase